MKRIVLSVCAAVAAAVSAWAITPNLPSSAYVRDGLVGQWDGIDNVGVGEHADSLMAWKDLVGEGDIVFTNASKGVSVAATANAVKIPVSYIGRGRCAALATAEGITVEVSARTTGSGNNNSSVSYFSNFMGYLGQSGNSYGFEIRYPKTDATIQRQRQGGASAEKTVFRTFSLTTKVGSRSLYMSGREWPYAMADLSEQAGSRSATFTVGNGTGFSAEHQSLRLYSRQLSWEERRMNALVDEIRFAGKGEDELPTGVRLSPDGTKLQVHLVIVPHGGALSINGATATTEIYDEWVDVNSRFTLAVESAGNRRVGWGDLLPAAVFSEDGLTATFGAVWPQRLVVEVFTPTHVWTGGGDDGLFSTAANWTDANGEPTSPPLNDRSAVVFVPSGTPAMTVDCAFTNGAFHVGSITNGSASVTVTFKHTKTNEVDGVVAIYRGAKLTHTALPEKLPDNRTYLDTTAQAATYGYRIILSARENLSVFDGATLTTVSCGFVAGRGPGKGSDLGSRGSSHGGRSTNSSYSGGDKTYGSVYYPYDHGSGMLRGGAGSGVIKLLAGGTMQIDGVVTSDGSGYNNMGPSAGSVLLEAGSLLGVGSISASARSGFRGGGGRIAIHLSEATDFGGFTGTIAAYGGNNDSAKDAGCGTIYLRSAGQTLAEGELIIDGGGRTSGATKVAEVDVTESEFGKVTIRGGGRLHLKANQVLKVSGDLSVAADGSASNIESEPTGVVDLSSGTNHLFSGTSSFANLVYTNVPDGKVSFADGAQVKMMVGGALTLAGTDGHLAMLYPQVTEGMWSLWIGADVAQAISYVAVSNSDATVGTMTATATKSRNDFGNNGWAFVGDVEFGDPITWNGSMSEDWNTPENWTDKTGANRTPFTTDEIFIPFDGVPRMPRITAGTTLAWKLNVSANASLTLDGGNLIVSERLAVAGALNCCGEETITCSNDVAFAVGSSFAKAHSFVRLVGSEDQDVSLAGRSFNKLQIKKDGGVLTMGDSFAAKTLSVRVGAPTEIRFAAGKTASIDELVLQGAVNGAAALTLSSTADSPWLIDLSGSAFVTGVIVDNSDACGGKTIVADAISSGSNVQNWAFGGNCLVWTGAKNSTFSESANWSPQGVPGPTTAVYVASSGAAKSLKVSAAAEIAALALDAQLGPVFMEIAAPLKVAGDVDLIGDATVTFTTASAELSADGSVRIGRRTTVTQAEAAASPVAAVRIAALGDLTVEAMSKINVNGCGCQSGGNGPGGSSASGTAVGHASRYAALGSGSGQTYGSILAPAVCGSGGWGTAGGGVVKLTVGGVLTVDGTISADSASGGGMGSGGSVFLTCATLAGSGLISACSHSYSTSYAYSVGSAGRIAVVATKADDFSSFTGDVSAECTWVSAENYQHAGPGTVYRKSKNVNEVCVGNEQGGIGVTDIPMADDGDAWKCYRETTFVGEKNVTYFLLEDMTVYDLDLKSTTSKIDLNGHTLTIRSSAHKKGKGWGDAYEKLVTESGGKIVWKGGMVLIIR